MRSKIELSIKLIRDILRPPRDSCLTYAPWHGPFGVHYTKVAGNCLRQWGHNPLRWIRLFSSIKRNHDVKAAYLYFRLSKHRPAFIIAWFIQHHERIQHVTGNAQR